MATNNSQKVTLRRVFADSTVMEAFEALCGEMIDAARDVPITGSDFYTESALLMKRESRVKTLRDIMAEFRAMHEDAKSDNFYNVNQT